MQVNRTLVREVSAIAWRFRPSPVPELRTYGDTRPERVWVVEYRVKGRPSQ
jgi:hypothetical protein